MLQMQFKKLYILNISSKLIKATTHQIQKNNLKINN